MNMSTATLTTRHPLARRGAAYTSLIKELDRRGDTALHSHERAQIIDCADGLLFDEANAAHKVKTVGELLDGLAESGRWTEESCQGLLELIEQIGPTAQAVSNS